MGFAVMPAPSAWRSAGLAVGLFVARSTGAAASWCPAMCCTVRRCCWPPCLALPLFTLLCGLRKGAFACRRFGLTLAHFGEHRVRPHGLRLCAYITGNVASNLFGGLLAAGVVDHSELAANFLRVRGPQSVGRDPRLVHRRAHRTRPQADMSRAAPLRSSSSTSPIRRCGQRADQHEFIRR